MSLILRSDIRQLMFDVEKIQRGFDVLEQNNSTLDMQCQQNQNHLAELIEHIKRLEPDVSTMLLDCESLGHRYWKDRNLHLIESLHISFTTMETLFSDLKKLRNTLSEVYMNLSDLQKLVVDWARFKKSIQRIQKSLKHTQKRRKNHAWFPTGRQRHSGQSGVDSMYSVARKARPSREPRAFQYLQAQ